MSAVVKLGSKMPGDVETNGIDQMVDDLLARPSTIRTAMVWFDVSKITVNPDEDTEVPTIRVRRIEPLGDANDVTDAIQTLVGQAMEKRTGRTPLPFGIVEVGEQAHGDPIDGVDA